MSVMTAAEARVLFQDVSLLTGTITIEQWDGAGWVAVAGWTGQPASISGKGVTKTALLPAAQTTLSSLTGPLKATIASSGIPAGPYAARFHDDVGSQGLVWRVGLLLLGSEGGDRWIAIQERDDGISAASERVLGIVTAYKAPPDDPSLITSAGAIQVQQDKNVMLIPPPVGVALERGLIMQSVALPAIRSRIMTLDLVDRLDDTNNPGYLEATLEPA